jgi:hypothetical protein
VSKQGVGEESSSSGKWLAVITNTAAPGASQ